MHGDGGSDFEFDDGFYQGFDYAWQVITMHALSKTT